LTIGFIVKKNETGRSGYMPALTIRKMGREHNCLKEEAQRNLIKEYRRSDPVVREMWALHRSGTRLRGAW
jgi:hypothetical protein